MVQEIMDYTGERMVPELADLNTFLEHIYRYRFVLPFIKDKQVLDIACGEGYGTSAIQKAGANRVIGIDISSDTCEHARTKYGINSCAGSAEEIPLVNNFADIIVSFETIEHLENPTSLLRETRRVLSNEGVLIISTPNKTIYDNRGENEFHKNEFTKTDFLNTLKRYYSSIQLFGQVPIAGHLYTRNSLRSLNIPTSDLPGFCLLKVIREKLLRKTFGNLREKRSFADLMILEKDDHFSKLLNPYIVRPIWANEENYVFYIAIVSK